MSGYKKEILMRVLKGRVLVLVKLTTSDGLVEEDNIRRGSVYVSGTSQINAGEEVLFGGNFEEIDFDVKTTNRYYLMEKENIKIIYESDDKSSAKCNVLPFIREKVSA